MLVIFGVFSLVNTLFGAAIALAVGALAVGIWA